jgi:phage terminase large subunit-like protein
LFRKTEKQIELYGLLKNNTHVLAEGGSRSGKTIAICHWIRVFAVKHPGVDVLILRLRFNHVKESIALQTFPTLDRLEEFNTGAYLNKTDYIYLFPNGSRIWLAGSDDQARVERILGKEFALIYFNESSQFSYKTYEIIQTRLNPPKGVPPRIILDQNPGNISHFTHKIFHERKFPDGRPIPDNDYAHIRINPSDNLENLSPDYIETLKQLSPRQRERFLYGNYSEDGGTLWRREWFRYGKLSHAANQGRTVIAIDPSGSTDGDAQGIVVACRNTENDTFLVLGDYTMNGTPSEWAAEVSRLYKLWGASAVIAERNYGGDMVEATLRTAFHDMNVIMATSTRGKLVRAEPISALYERGRVYHAEEFTDLENELCGYTGQENEASPNRLDALVFCLSELSSISAGISIEGGTSSLLRNKH